MEAVNALVSAGSDIHAQDAAGFTPLNMAAQQGKVETINALLAAGSNIQTPATTGVTPLHSAAAFGTPEAINALIDAGANIHAMENRGSRRCIRQRRERRKS